MQVAQLEWQGAIASFVVFTAKSVDLMALPGLSASTYLLIIAIHHGTERSSPAPAPHAGCPA